MIFLGFNKKPKPAVESCKKLTVVSDKKKLSLLRVKKGIAQLCWDSSLNSRPKDGIPQCIVALVSKKSMGFSFPF